MDLPSVGQYIVPAVSATATLIGIFLTTRKNTVLRNRIKTDSEILSALPDKTEAQSAMTAHIEWEIAELRHAETVGERQWAIGIFALLCAVALTVLSTWIALQGGWTRLWLVGTVPVTLLFIFGMVDSLAKLPRDEKGNTIRTKSTDESS